MIRPIDVKCSNKEVTIYVGKVDQSGNYKLLKLSEAEAAVLTVKLQEKLSEQY